MNHCYRLVWNQRAERWDVAHENARILGKRPGARRLLSVAVTAALAGLALEAHALPSGEQISAGAGSIARAGSTMTVTQGSPKLAINWQSFGIAASESVVFRQPDATSVALNRVLGTDPSAIYGRLSANGQVFLLNSNGIFFAPGAQVNVGGLVASTLKLSDTDFMAGRFRFSGAGGSILNQGSLSAADGGYVALLGGQVSNEGTIQARLGTVALAAGNAISLDFAGDRLMNVQVDEGAVAALVQNKQLIRADGGTVLMTAKAADALVMAVVNNEGVIEARTVQEKSGAIWLLGDMHNGVTRVAGTLDASAPNGGNGGFVETSAAHVKVADGAKVTTATAMGLAGTWLIDPQDYTVAASGGDMSGATLSSNLNNGNVTLASGSGGSAGSGNLNVNDGVTWSANTILTLTASHNVSVNSNLTASGSNAGLAINPNTANGPDAASGSGTFNLAMGSTINLPNVSPSSQTALVIGGQSYTVINSLGGQGSTSGTDLQGINGKLSGLYALGGDIDASPTNGWNGGAGFTPIGQFAGAFNGTLNGLGHVIRNLTINRPNATDYVGLFAATGPTAQIRNVGIAGGSVIGSSTYGEGLGTGGLAGINKGTISNSHASTSVTGGSGTGGLAGTNYGAISNSFATGQVMSSANIDYRGFGGLVGINLGSISGSYATGQITGYLNNDWVGGLVGSNGQPFMNSVVVASATISNSYASGVTSAGARVGGLVGLNTGVITGSRADGVASGTGSVGGLVGGNFGDIANSYATGAAVPSQAAINVYKATNGQFGGTFGGLVGYNNQYATVTNSFATGHAIGFVYVGGLVGTNQGTITNSYSTSSTATAGEPGFGDKVKAVGEDFLHLNIGGLFSAIGSLFSPTPTPATPGGLVGHNIYGTVVNSYAANDRPLVAYPDGNSITGSALSATQLRAQSSFVSWDFANTWLIYEGLAPPQLRSFMSPLTVTANTVFTAYSGSPYPGFGITTWGAAANTVVLGTTTYGAAQGALDPGTYAIQPGGLFSLNPGVRFTLPDSGSRTSQDVGYAITFLPGTLTIWPSTQTNPGEPFPGGGNGNNTGGVLPQWHPHDGFVNPSDDD